MLISGHEHRPRPDRAEARRRRGQLRAPRGHPGAGPEEEGRPGRLSRARPDRIHAEGPRRGGRPRPRADRRFGRLVARTKGLSAVFGFVEESPAEKGLFYNAAAFLADGRIVHIHRKVFLPTNGMFEEAKLLRPGPPLPGPSTPHSAGPGCSSAGTSSTRRELRPLRRGSGRDRSASRPPRDAASGGATRSRRAGCGSSWARALSYFSTAFVVYANRVGSEDGVTFAGGSFVFAPGGQARRPGRRASTRTSSSVPSTWRRRPGPPHLALQEGREARGRLWRSLERIVRASED